MTSIKVIMKTPLEITVTLETSENKINGFVGNI